MSPGRWMLRKRSGAAVPHQCRQLLSGLRGLGAAESGASVDGGGDGASGASAAAYGGHVEAACCAMSAVEHGFLVDGEESDGKASMDSGHQGKDLKSLGVFLSWCCRGWPLHFCCRILFEFHGGQSGRVSGSVRPSSLCCLCALSSRTKRV